MVTGILAATSIVLPLIIIQSPLAILDGQNPALLVRYSKGSGIETDGLGLAYGKQNSRGTYIGS